ncbi:uncharacterized protein LOC111912039 [Lactuca sativa]|uniref:uncharacterized protein LOC111912039 n=1 Tax=Lactuca sativa TaxID=4236 RepID=UPI000CD81930|nr:uncharacterized protein LOC111912039 [Lactuca sativa]
MDCRQGDPVLGMRLCYHIDQVGHGKANGPLLAAKPAQVPAPATLRITDGRPVKAEPPKAQGCAFQLTTEEAKAAPDVGASRSFVSQTFSRGFGVPVGELECPLRASIANEHGVYASSVYRGCQLEIFEVVFPIDLIVIRMWEVSVIVGMDWLSHFGAMIDYEGQQAVVRAASGGALIIYGEGTRTGSGFCSEARARQYIQHRCAGYLAYVVDMQVGDQTSVSEVPVLKEFANVLPEELPGIHPERRVEFRINLVPGAAPISKASYRLAPPEM